MKELMGPWQIVNLKLIGKLPSRMSFSGEFVGQLFETLQKITSRWIFSW